MTNLEEVFKQGVQFERLRVQANILFEDISKAKSNVERSRMIRSYYHLTMENLEEIIQLGQKNYVSRTEANEIIRTLIACSGEKEYQERIDYIKQQRKIIEEEG